VWGKGSSPSDGTALCHTDYCLYCSSSTPVWLARGDGWWTKLPCELLKEMSSDNGWQVRYTRCEDVMRATLKPQPDAASSEKKNSGQSENLTLAPCRSVKPLTLQK
jgi:hypothetical protein